MKKIGILAAALVFALPPLAAQTPGGRIHRTEVAPYRNRDEAETRTRGKDDAAYMVFAPEVFLSDGRSVSAGQVLDIPYAWTDGCVFLHLENPGAAYTLTLNDRTVAEVEDPATPAEFELTPYVREGRNALIVELRPSRTPALQEGTPAPEGKPFAGSYLYMQHKRSIADFTLSLVPDSTQRFGVLRLDIAARNACNYEETVTVGYDVYSPQGKLLDYSITDLTVAGRSCDTLHLTPYVYGTYENKWEPGAKNDPPLYRVMLFTRRDGAYKEYIPLRTGFRDIVCRDGRWYSFGREIVLREARCNAAADRTATRTAMVQLKKQGINTLRPDHPQPAWYYDLCDELGLMVIDRADINAPAGRTDRRVGGTPSNDPSLVDEYLERVRAMYYRSRNHTCVIAYALGGASGNGYNMYKAYQWLKSAETQRPLFCEDADGEWNRDL